MEYQKQDFTNALASQIGLIKELKFVKFAEIGETFGDETSSIQARPLAG